MTPGMDVVGPVRTPSPLPPFWTVEKTEKI